MRGAVRGEWSSEPRQSKLQVGVRRESQDEGNWVYACLVDLAPGDWSQSRGHSYDCLRSKWEARETGTCDYV